MQWKNLDIFCIFASILMIKSMRFLKRLSTTFLLIFLVSACKKDSSVNNLNTVGPGPADSIFVLSKVTTSDGESVSLVYDTLFKRYTSWSQTYSYNDYDSVKINYDPQGNVISLVDNGSPHTFVYNTSGQVKAITSSYQGINYYDSINYYPGTNNIASIYELYPQYPGMLRNYMKVHYLSTNDSLISDVETYSLNANNLYDSSIVSFTSYNNIPNPYYKYFHKFCFMGGSFRPLCDLPTLPSYYYGFTINRYLTANPYLCTSINNSPISYLYNTGQDSTLPGNCYSGSDGTEFVNFQYIEVRK
jgi:YD repeat-containing protein